jgi:hypothetical protein
MKPNPFDFDPKAFHSPRHAAHAYVEAHKRYEGRWRRRALYALSVVLPAVLVLAFWIWMAR